MLNKTNGWFQSILCKAKIYLEKSLPWSRNCKYKILSLANPLGKPLLFLYEFKVAAKMVTQFSEPCIREVYSKGFSPNQRSNQRFAWF